jgi:hypothetical protein
MAVLLSAHIAWLPTFSSRTSASSFRVPVHIGTCVFLGQRCFPRSRSQRSRNSATVSRVGSVRPDPDGTDWPALPPVVVTIAASDGKEFEEPAAACEITIRCRAVGSSCNDHVAIRRPTAGELDGRSPVCARLAQVIPLAGRALVLASPVSPTSTAPPTWRAASPLHFCINASRRGVRGRNQDRVDLAGYVGPAAALGRVAQVGFTSPTI